MDWRIISLIYSYGHFKHVEKISCISPRTPCISLSYSSRALIWYKWHLCTFRFFFLQKNIILWYIFPIFSKPSRGIWLKNCPGIRDHLRMLWANFQLVSSYDNRLYRSNRSPAGLFTADPLFYQFSLNNSFSMKKTGKSTIQLPHFFFDFTYVHKFSLRSDL